MRAPSLAGVMDVLEGVDRRRDALHACLELQGQVERVVARLVQVAAVEPQRLLLGRLTHVALLALPGPGVLSSIRAQAPALADAVGGLPADYVGDPAVHRRVAGGVDD